MALKIKETRPDGGRYSKACVGITEELANIYVHIGYVTQALYFCIHIASADFTL